MSSLSLSFASTLENVNLVRGVVSGVCREYLPHASRDACGDCNLCLAVVEALNNVVKYAGSKKIDMELAVSSREIVLRIFSEGKKFDPTSDVVERSEDPSGAMPEGGYGLTIIRSTVDELKYQYREGKNVLTLTKKMMPCNMEG